MDINREKGTYSAEELYRQGEKAIKGYARIKKDAKSFYSGISSFALLSPQDRSFEKDASFLDECSSLLSVISYIAFKPRLEVKYIDSISRSDLAPKISNDDLLATIHDRSLWKRKNGEMSPEYVHFEESVDKLATYENLFVMKIIRMLSKAIGEYDDFYHSLLKDISSVSLNEDYEDVTIIFQTINHLKKKMRRIESTYFYKELSKAKDEIVRVYPTNILLDDHSYSKLYRFYNKHKRFLSEGISRLSLFDFYLLSLMQTLKERGYKLESNPSINIDDEFEIGGTLIFVKGDKSLKITPIRKRAFMDIETDLSTIEGHISAKHGLFINEDPEFGSAYRYISQNGYGEYVSYEGLGIFSLLYWNGSSFEKRDPSSKSSIELVNDYLDSLFIIKKASKILYTKNCPNCLSTEIEHEGDDCHCLDCGSLYSFYKDGENDYIYIKKLGRKRK